MGLEDVLLIASQSLESRVTLVLTNLGGFAGFGMARPVLSWRGHLELRSLSQVGTEKKPRGA